MKTGRLQIRLSEPLATYVRHLAISLETTSTQVVERAITEALGRIPANTAAGRTLRAVGYRTPRTVAPGQDGGSP